jgi:hypothetical protein
MGDFDREHDRRVNDFNIATRLAELRADVSDLAASQVELAAAQERLSVSQEAQANATAALVDAWNTGTGLVKFVKWLASFAGACATIWAVTHADLATMAKSIFR